MVKVVYENITYLLLGMWTNYLDLTLLSLFMLSPLLHVTDLLSWSEEDMRVHPQAAVLGAPLEAGKDLYPELQGTYNC